jgi:hypothetical protein
VGSLAALAPRDYWAALTLVSEVMQRAAEIAARVSAKVEEAAKAIAIETLYSSAAPTRFAR